MADSLPKSLDRLEGLGAVLRDIEEDGGSVDLLWNDFANTHSDQVNGVLRHANEVAKNSGDPTAKFRVIAGFMIDHGVEKKQHDARLLRAILEPNFIP